MLQLSAGGQLTVVGAVSGATVGLTTTAGDIFLSGSGTVSGTTSATLLAADSVVTAGTGSTIGATTVNLTATGARISLGGAVTGTTVNMTSHDSITDVSKVTASTLNLTSTAGDIGGTTALTVVSPNVSANAANGSVNILDTATGTVTIGASGANTASGAFAFEANGATTLTNSGAIGGHTVSLTASATGGVIALPSAVNGRTVNLTSDGDITDVTQVTAGTLNLTSTHGSIGGTTALAVVAGTLTANAANGSVNILDTYTDGGTNTVTIGASGANTTTGTFALAASNAGILTNSGAISANTVNLTASASGAVVNLGAAVTGTSSGTVSLTSNGNITNVTNVFSSTLNLTSTAGDIGSSTTALATSAETMSVSAHAGSAWIKNSGDLTLTSAVVSGVFSLNADLTITGPVTGDTIVITETAGSGDILVTSGGYISGTTSVTMTAAHNLTTAGTGNTISAPTVSLTATGGAISLGDTVTGTSGGTVSLTSHDSITDVSQVTASALSVTSTAGSIGSSAVSRLVTSVSSLTVSANGDAWITNIGDMTFATSGTIGNNLDVSGTGSLTVTGVHAANQLVLSANGNIQVDGNISGSVVWLIASAGTSPGDVIVSGTGSMTGGTEIHITGSNDFTSNGLISANAVVIRVTGALNINHQLVGSSTYLTSGASITDVSNVLANILYLTSNSGNIGTSGSSPLVTDSTYVSLSAPSGNAWVSNSKALELVSASAQGAVQVASTGDMTVSGEVSGTTVDLRANVGTTVGNLNVNANVTGSTSVALTAANNFVLGDSTLVSADQVGITATNGTITLNGNVTGTHSGTVYLTAGDNTASAIQESGAISAGVLTVNLASSGSPVAMLSGANSVGALGASGVGSIQFNNGSTDLQLLGFGGQSLTVTLAGAITTGADNTGFTGLSLTGASIAISNAYMVSGVATLEATTGDVAISGVFTGNGVTSMTSDAGNVSILTGGSVIGTGSKALVATVGQIALGGDVNGSSVALTAGNSGASAIVQTAGAITAPSLTVNLPSGGTATLSQTNNVGTLAGSGTGPIVFSNGTNPLQLQGFGAQSLTVSAAGAITTGADNTGFTGLSLTGTSIAISNAYTVSGAATLEATTGNVAISGVFTGNGVTSMTSDAGNVSILTGGSVIGTGSKALVATVGQIALGGNVNGSAITLTAGDSTVSAMTQTAGIINTAGTLTVNLPNGGTGTLSQANDVAYLAGSGTGSIVFNNDTNALLLLGFGTQSLTVTHAGAITTSSDNTGLTGLSLTGRAIIISNAYTVSGAATLEATDFNIRLSGAFTGNGTTNITSDNGDVNIVTGGSLVGTGSTALVATVGRIALGGSISGSSVALTAGNSGISAMTQTAGAITTALLTVNLPNGGSANLGQANSVVALAGTGSGAIDLNNGTTDLQLQGFGAQSLTVSSAGAITTSVDNTSLTALNLTGASIAIGNVYAMTGAATLVATTGDITATTTGIICSPTISLTSTLGNIGGVLPVAIRRASTGSGAVSLTVTAGQAAYIGDGAGDAVTISGTSSAGTILFEVVTGTGSGGTIAVSAGVSASNGLVLLNSDGDLSVVAGGSVTGKQVQLVSNNGSIALAGTVIGVDSVTLSAQTFGIGNITQSSGILVSPAITLQAGNAIGSSSAKVEIASSLIGADLVQLIAIAQHGAYITDNSGDDIHLIGGAGGTGAFELSNSALGGTIQIDGTVGSSTAGVNLVSYGQIFCLVGGDISGNTVSLTSLLGDIVLNDNVTAAGSVVMSAGTDIAQNSHTIQGSTVSLTADGDITVSGNINSSHGNNELSADTITNYGTISATTGRIVLEAETITNNNRIQAGGTSLFTSVEFRQVNGILNVVNNGYIVAMDTDSNGTVGFNGGQTGDITLIAGVGSAINAGTGVTFGYLDSDLSVIPPAVLITPTTGINYNYSRATTWGGHITIFNQDINAPVVTVSAAPTPPVPPTPTPVTPGTEGTTGGTSLLLGYLGEPNTAYLVGVVRVATDLTPPSEPSVTTNTVATFTGTYRTPVPGGIPGALFVSADVTAAIVEQMNSTHFAVVNFEGSGALKLISGNLLLAPEADITVHTDFGSVFVAKGAVVFLMRTTDSLCVFNLSDSHTGEVSVVSGNQSIDPNMGNLVLLTRTQMGFDALNPAKLIGYRGVQKHSLEGGVTAYTAEFSLVSALSQVSPLNHLVYSSNPSARRLAQELLRNAAILAQLKSSQGPYKQCQ